MSEDKFKADVEILKMKYPRWRSVAIDSNFIFTSGVKSLGELGVLFGERCPMSGDISLGDEAEYQSVYNTYCNSEYIKEVLNGK